jgi:hypothetical protein
LTSNTPSPISEHRHVERAAAEVEDEDRLVAAFLVEPVRERGRGRLVDDAQHLEGAISPASLVAWRWASSKYAGR